MAAAAFDAKASNTALVNAAYRAAHNLRFSGVAIPDDVWDSATALIVALDRWYGSDRPSAPERITDG